MTLTTRWNRALMAAASSALTLLLVGPALAQSRGELLYATHCIACHSTQVHWRDKKVVVDWPSLRAQVRQWQGTARLDWTDDDIEQVALYLNQRHYRLAAPASRRADGAPHPGAALAAVLPKLAR